MRQGVQLHTSNVKEQWTCGQSPHSCGVRSGRDHCRDSKRNWSLTWISLEHSSAACECEMCTVTSVLQSSSRWWRTTFQQPPATVPSRHHSVLLLCLCWDLRLHSYKKKEDFQRCFQQWQDCWSKCICAEGLLFGVTRLHFFTFPLH